MTTNAVRLVVCLFVGAMLGVPLGTLFVPDPTGVVAAVAASTVTAVIAGGLYRGKWLTAA